MTLTIRKATLEDTERLTTLRLAFLREIGELSSPSHEIQRATSYYLKETIPSGDFVAWVAEVQGEIVATSGLVFFEHPPFEHNLSGRSAFILNMYTVPQWRGKGLATQLLRELLVYARQAGVRRVWLYATEDGRPVYEKAGFVAKRRKSLEMELCWEE